MKASCARLCTTIRGVIAVKMGGYGFGLGWLLGCITAALVIGFWMWCAKRFCPLAAKEIQINIHNTARAGHASESTSGIESLGTQGVIVNPTQEEVDPPPNPEALHLPRVPRNATGGRRRVHMYITSRGNCVHVSRECSALRGAETQERPICQKCFYKPFKLH